MRPQKRQRTRAVLDSDDEQPSNSQASATSNVKTKARADTERTQSKRRAVSVAQKRGKSSSLHTFFTARTQFQRTGSTPSSRGASPFTPDVIEQADIDEDIEEVDTSEIEFKRKSTPTASQPRNAPTREGVTPVSTDHARPPQSSVSVTTSSRPWVDQFPPLNASELAVHKKKLTEVDEWLRSASTGNQYRRLLVLKGPAGSGKTATARTLAAARGLDVLEWSNPSSGVYGDEDFQSASAQFAEFLGRSAPFASLSFNETENMNLDETSESEPVGYSQMTLIEEFHVLTRWSPALARFRETMLLHLSSTSYHPVVVVLSEEDSTISNEVETMTAHSLLGPELLQHPAVAVIEFNPVAPTFLAKALDLVIKKEARLSGRRRIPGPSVLRALAEIGDIRSAIGTLEMMCIQEDDSTLTGRVAAKPARGSGTRGELTVGERATLNAISQRESTLGMFHAVGKVVYNKREQKAEDQPPAHLNHHGRLLSSLVDVDELFAQSATDVDTFVAALHENYVLSCEAEDALGHVEGCLDSLSDADLMTNIDSSRSARGNGRRTYQGSSALDTTRHNEIIFNVGVRGLLFSLPYPVKRKARSGISRSDPYKILYPESIRLRRQVLDMQELLHQYAYSRTADASDAVGKNSGQAKTGVETWASTWSAFNLPEDGRERILVDSDTTSLMSMPDKGELVAVQIPFTLMIRGTDAGSSDLAKISRLASITTFGAETQPGFMRGQAKRSQNKTHGGKPDVEEEPPVVEKLTLSDDDIEDD